MATGRSLQLHLLVLLSASISLVWLVVAVWTWVDASHEVDELMDGHLAQAAAILVVQPLELTDDAVADAPVLHRYGARVAFQVFHEGALVMRSSNVGEEPLSKERDGFDTVRYGGESWRVFATRGAESDVQVYVGEQVDSRNDIVLAMLRGMLLPMALAFPLLVYVLWWAVHRALIPLRVLGDTLGQRKPDALNPVVLPETPREMQPLVAELNELLLRIERMLASERRFTADAAHELRTPIAAIRAQAQVALGAVGNKPERDLALNTTVAGCDRAAHIVDQLLALSRLEAGQTEAVTQNVDLSAVAQQVTADLAPTALARKQDLSLEADKDCMVAAHAVWLTMLIRNLVDNALRYSPDSARVLVRVGRSASGRVVLDVHDSGPGMVGADIERLGERFFRVLGHVQTGSGLGWSIVRRIAEATGAQVAVRPSVLLGGLHVQIEWPDLRK
ncbi:ATP-binding protein [Polaromonas sp. YR568]|uniref:ATP-binding protein n=1 Tax=Polaromonas sp. YR568 TaxID=1855301 RepID=UPI003137C976